MMMSSAPRLSLVPFERTTCFAPLVALGCFVRDHDLLAPLTSRLHFEQPMHTRYPSAALLDLWVSMLAGCRAVAQINTRLRPDRLLAQAWGRECFAEQSTVARVLDGCAATQVAQLREGVEQLYRWLGQAPQHAWRTAPLLIDIDLTGMPAGRQAEGSTPGYFSGKRGPAAGNCAAWAPPTTTKVSVHSCTPVPP